MVFSRRGAGLGYQYA